MTLGSGSERHVATLQNTSSGTTVALLAPPPGSLVPLPIGKDIVSVIWSVLKQMEQHLPVPADIQGQSMNTAILAFAGEQPKAEFANLCRSIFYSFPSARELDDQFQDDEEGKKEAFLARKKTAFTHLDDERRTVYQYDRRETGAISGRCVARAKALFQQYQDAWEESMGSRDWSDNLALNPDPTRRTVPLSTLIQLFHSVVDQPPVVIAQKLLNILADPDKRRGIAISDDALRQLIGKALSDDATPAPGDVPRPAMAAAAAIVGTGGSSAAPAYSASRTISPLH